MYDMIEFFIDKDPYGKGRHRFTRGGFCYTPKETKEYEKYVRHIIVEARGSQRPFQSAAYMIFHAGVKIPKSFSKKKRALALSGELEPTKKPDLDNIEKAILDACNKIAMEDDKQVTKVYKEKFYSEITGTKVVLFDNKFEFREHLLNLLLP